MAAITATQRVLASITVVAQTPTVTDDLESCTKHEVFKRVITAAPAAPTSCSYGTCGTTCLAQGAFCCGPGKILNLDHVND